MKTRRREPLPVKGYKLVSNRSTRRGSHSTSLQEAVRTAPAVLLGPVGGDLSYDMELTRRYRIAAEIVNGWLGLSHRQRIVLNRSLPWDEMVQLVSEAKAVPLPPRYFAADRKTG